MVKLDCAVQSNHLVLEKDVLWDSVGHSLLGKIVKMLQLTVSIECFKPHSVKCTKVGKNALLSPRNAF